LGRKITTVVNSGEPKEWGRTRERRLFDSRGGGPARNRDKNSPKFMQRKVKTEGGEPGPTTNKPWKRQGGPNIKHPPGRDGNRPGGKKKTERVITKKWDGVILGRATRSAKRPTKGGIGQKGVKKEESTPHGKFKSRPGWKVPVEEKQGGGGAKGTSGGLLDAGRSPGGTKRGTSTQTHPQKQRGGGNIIPGNRGLSWGEGENPSHSESDCHASSFGKKVDKKVAMTETLRTVWTSKPGNGQLKQAENPAPLTNEWSTSKSAGGRREKRPRMSILMKGGRGQRNKEPSPVAAVLARADSAGQSPNKREWKRKATCRKKKVRQTDQG